MRKFFLIPLSFLSLSVSAQTFNYNCEGHKLQVNLSPNSAVLDGRSFNYQSGQTDGETTKLTFFGPSGEVFKFLVNPVANLYRMGLTKDGAFEEKDCTEV